MRAPKNDNIPEMSDGNKRAFWLFVLGALAVICIPSTLLLRAIQGYGRFLCAFEPDTLRPRPAAWGPRSESAGAAVAPVKLEFADFRLRAPKAKRVCVVGDFNGWKDGSATLARRAGGNFELTLPLSRGRHSYLFVVDGAEKTDPRNSLTGTFEGRKVSIKVVQ